MARAAEFFSERTAWVRRLQTPLRQFLRTETGGAAVVLAAAVAALVWVNVDATSYEELWGTKLSLALGGEGLELSLREWVNSGLMTFFFFFFVLGLETRREFDLGELRERRRLALPMLAAIGGMAAAIAIYLAFNLGGSTAHGWGIAMSTDTALALGLLGLAGRRVPDRLRAFILTVVVVDDLLALVVIATAYTDNLELAPLLRPGGARGARTAARLRRRALRLAAPAAGRRAPQRRARRRGLGGRSRPGRVLADAHLLLEHQDALGPADLVRYADQLGLDVERFKDRLRKHAGAHRIAEDVEGADLSGVSGTPTFFINGRRHYGAYDIAALSAAVRGAGARAGWRRPERLSVTRPPDSPSASPVPPRSPERRDDGSLQPG